MSDHCGSATEEGAAVCVPGACSCSPETKSSETTPLLLPLLDKDEKKEPQVMDQFNGDQENTMWKKIRGAVMFGIACITSPCCTPIIVPVAIALLAGTPIAVWLSAYIGWVYGGLTLLSVLSLVLGFRWMGQKAQAKRPAKMLSKIAASGDL